MRKLKLVFKEGESTTKVFGEGGRQVLGNFE